MWNTWVTSMVVKGPVVSSAPQETTVFLVHAPTSTQTPLTTTITTSSLADLHHHAWWHLLKNNPGGNTLQREIFYLGWMLSTDNTVFLEEGWEDDMVDPEITIDYSIMLIWNFKCHMIKYKSSFLITWCFVSV